MHPELLSRLAAIHAADLHNEARRRRASLGIAPRRRLRRRAGWWMVGVGLHLAMDRSEARRFRPVVRPS